MEPEYHMVGFTESDASMKTLVCKLLDILIVSDQWWTNELRVLFNLLLNF